MHVFLPFVVLLLRTRANWLCALLSSTGNLLVTLRRCEETDDDDLGSPLCAYAAVPSIVHIKKVYTLLCPFICFLFLLNTHEPFGRKKNGNGPKSSLEMNLQDFYRCAPQLVHLSSSLASQTTDSVDPRSFRGC